MINMKPAPVTPLTEDELHALVDGQATPDELAEWQTRLDADPDAQALLRQWKDQRDALRHLHRDVLDEPVPLTLLQAARNTESAHNTSRQWHRYGGKLAAIVLAFGTGWLANGSWQTVVMTHNAPGLTRLQPEDAFVRQAVVAHGVYTPEVRHPVEVTATEQSHLVQWLSKRLGKPLKVPDLTAQGFELVGGRLLPGESGARAQFMFQNTAGHRITLYLGALDGAATQGLSGQETGFRYEPQGSVPSFYWVDQGFGYALAGQFPKDVLMKLADSVYHQL